jgi:hypothetical protein
MILRHFIEKERGKALGKDDVMRMSYRKGLRYLYYDDIGNKTLKELLPEKNSARLILFVDHKHPKRKIGHFCLLFRHERSGLHFWDPYGLGLRVVTHMTKSKKKLEKILERTDVQINKHQYQQRKNDVNTCGRHCITRWNCAQMKELEYERFVHDSRLNSEEIVILLTLEQDLSKLKL